MLTKYRHLVIASLAAGCVQLDEEPLARKRAPERPTFPAPPRRATEDVVAACPADAPVASGACATVGMTCEYGASPDMRCNTTLACVPDERFGSAWTARPSVLCPTYACPTGLVERIDGTSCDALDAGAADELVCPMTDGVCACTTGRSAAGGHARRWVCVKPGPSCPPARPLAGHACASGPVCDYGSCAFERGLQMTCTSNVWLTGSATCE